MRKGCGSIRHERSVGNTVKGIDSRGSACDLNKVTSLFESVGSKPSQNNVTTTRDTAACPPFLGWLGSSSSTTSGAWTSPEAKLNPIWGYKTCFLQVSSARVDGLDAARTIVVIHCAQNCCPPNWSCALSVSVGHCLRQPNPPEKGNVAAALADSGTASGSTPTRVGKVSPDFRFVPRGEFAVWADSTNEEVRPGHTTVQENELSTLQVLHERDLLQEFSVTGCP